MSKCWACESVLSEWEERFKRPFFGDGLCRWCYEDVVTNHYCAVDMYVNSLARVQEYIDGL